MTIVNLPVVQPLVRSYLHHAHSLSIISDNPNLLPDIMNNFIQLFSTEHERDYRIDFFHYDGKYPRYPGIAVNWMSREYLIEATIELCSFIKASIRQGKYIEIVLDEFYIPGKWAFQKHHIPHQNLIYGYDEFQNQFLIFGFDEHMTFGHFRIEYADLYNAFYESSWSGLSFITTDRPMDYTNTSLGWNCELIGKYAQDFLNSENSFVHFKDPRSVFGIAVYQDVCERLQSKLLSFDDVRPFHVFLEHKQLMVKRLKAYGNDMNRIDEFNDLILEYQDLESEFAKLRNAVLIQRKKQKPIFQNEIIQRLMLLAKQEEKTTIRLIDRIKGV